MNKTLVSLLIYLSLFLLSGCLPPPGEGAASGAPTEMGPELFLHQTVIFILMGIMAYWFMVLRPEQKESEKREKFLESAKKNTPLVTSGGIHGRYISHSDGVVTIEIANNVKIKVSEAEVHPVKESAESLPAKKGK